MRCDVAVRCDVAARARPGPACAGGLARRAESSADTMDAADRSGNPRRRRDRSHGRHRSAERTARCFLANGCASSRGLDSRLRRPNHVTSKTHRRRPEKDTGNPRAHRVAGSRFSYCDPANRKSLVRKVPNGKNSVGFGPRDANPIHHPVPRNRGSRWRTAFCTGAKNARCIEHGPLTRTTQLISTTQLTRTTQLISTAQLTGDGGRAAATDCAND